MLEWVPVVSNTSPTCISTQWKRAPKPKKGAHNKRMDTVGLRAVIMFFDIPEPDEAKFQLPYEVMAKLDNYTSYLFRELA